MGRKGGGKKAFLKGVVAKPDADEVSATAIDDQAEGGPSSADTQTETKRSDIENGSASCSPAHLPEVTSTAQDLESESRGQLTQRHKKEAKALKEATKRLGKKKKDDVARLETEMDERHAAEAAALEQRERDAAGPQEETTDILATDLYSFSLSAAETQKQKQPTKAQKRRQHQADRDAEREAELEAERAQQGESEQAVEDKQLREMLTPLGLTIRAIQPDGHCMYRAVQDQLNLRSNGDSHAAEDVAELRKKTADYIRHHQDDFLPFLIQDLDEDDLETSFEQYCQDIRDTAAWGGQTELNALAHVLQHHIKVYAAGLPVVVMGQQYQGERQEPLAVCYLRHAFALGEHYNSVVPAEAASSDDEAAFEQIPSSS
ncbi:hypothetical protein WJX79_000332 [Trebouxia sp. C0005]|nr:MAG: cysteine ases family [Trebouxia sp. A1-2]